VKRPIGTLGTIGTAATAHSSGKPYGLGNLLRRKTFDMIRELFTMD
jgi:hypothetical protein